MLKYLISLLVLIIVLCGCHGCSFLKDRFAKKQTIDQTEEINEQQEAVPERKSDPIPTNPHHS